MFRWNNYIRFTISGANHTWYLNDEVIEGESLSTIEISEAGVYSVDIVFSEECSTSDSILIEYKPSPVIEASSDLLKCNAGSPSFDLTENDSLISVLKILMSLI